MRFDPSPKIAFLCTLHDTQFMIGPVLLAYCAHVSAETPDMGKDQDLPVSQDMHVENPFLHILF